MGKKSNLVSCFVVLLFLALSGGCAYDKPVLSELPLHGQTVEIILNRGNGRTDCDTLVFSCIDYRFAFANQEFVNTTLGLKGNYSHISIPGSIYNLVNPETRDIVFGKVTNLVNFHLIKHVVIIAHKDCGGYGGSSAFGSKLVEQEYLSADLRKVRNILLEKYPILNVELYLEELTPEGVIFEKVQ